MKNQIAIFLTILTFALMSCNKKVEQADSQLNDESILFKMNTYINEILVDSISYLSYLKNFNPDKYSNFASNIYDLSVTKNQSLSLKNASTNDSDFLTYLKEQPKPSCFEKPLTAIEKSIFVSISQSLKDKSLTESIVILNSVEMFLSENICDNDQLERLLYLTGALKIGYVKHSSMIKLKSATSLLNTGGVALKGEQFDICYDVCMNQRYSNMNLIDWIEFGLNPPAHVAWNAGSCAWDCAWKESSSTSTGSGSGSYR